MCIRDRTSCGLFKFLDSITAGTEDDSPGMPNVIAGILPMYCDIVVNAVYNTIICKGSRCIKYGKIISRAAKLPIPGIQPLINPERTPTSAGEISSVIVCSV